jgi:TonB-dependent receptor
MHSLKKLFYTLLLVSSSIMYAETGTIRGTLTDKSTGEALIGANVILKGTTIGSTTDLDGLYSIENIEEGTYTLEVSYLSYRTQFIEQVIVKVNEVTLVNTAMEEESSQLEEVVIVASIANNNVNALYAMQQKSANVMDGISAQTFKATGDNDAGNAIKKVTGVSIQGGRYVYVRGLGDRYSKTILNGMELPGLDPERNTVQMDMFPTQIIDNIIVYKTFTPDLPASFTGGLIDVRTKDFPDNRTITFTATIGINTNVGFKKNFLTYDGSKGDVFGFGKSGREFPINSSTILPSIASSNYQITKDATLQMDNNMEAQVGRGNLNESYALSAGNQWKILKSGALGLMYALNYRIDSRQYTDGFFGDYYFPGKGSLSLLPNVEFKDHKSTTQLIFSQLLNVGMKINTNNKIGWVIMHNQNGNKTTRIVDGIKFTTNDGFGYREHNLLYDQRSVTFGEMYGTHFFEKAKGSQLDWKFASAFSSLDQPDNRFFNYGYTTENDMLRYTIFQSPSRVHRGMKEVNYDVKMDYNLPLTIWKEMKAKFKAGAAYNYKTRKYQEVRFDYGPSANESFDGNISDYIDDANVYDPESNREGTFLVNVYQNDNYNDYSGVMQIAAAYAMIELPIIKKLKIITGTRLETTHLSFTSEDNTKQALLKLKDKTLLKNVDILPSFAIVYNVAESMNLRFGYGRTLARPSFREVAPISIADFLGGRFLTGNPNLQRTLVDNLDIRYEWFTAPGCILSASAFYKLFHNPIEVTNNTQVSSGEISYQNVNKATLYGFEVEARQKMDIIHNSLIDITIGVNASYIKSIVDVPEEEYNAASTINENVSRTRSMYGQSPFLINTFIEYSNNWGTVVNINYNVQGKRLARVSIGGTPNIFELPQSLLNLKASQSFGKQKSMQVSFTATNLINPEFRETITYLDKDYYQTRYKSGRNFSIGFSYSFR